MEFKTRGATVWRDGPLTLALRRLAMTSSVVICSHWPRVTCELKINLAPVWEDSCCLLLCAELLMEGRLLGAQFNSASSQTWCEAMIRSVL